LVLEVAAQNSAWVMVDRSLKRLGVAVPVDFSRKAASVTEAGRKRATWNAQILTQAAQAGIEVIVLKGGLLGSVVYGDPAYKKMNDIDVLVRFENAPAFAEILRKNSFTSVGKLLSQKEFSDKSHHSPPFVSPDLACMVGLHWGLTSPHSVWKPDLESVWSKRKEAEVCGARAFQMCWEHQVLHACTHLPFFKIGVRELADVYNTILFAQKRGEFDWHFFVSETRRWQAFDAVYRVQTLARELILFEMPESLLGEFRTDASSFTVHDTKKRIALGPAFVATRSVHVAQIEKAFTVFSLSKNYRERVKAWAKTWSLTFYPPAQEVPRLLGKVGPQGFFQRVLDRFRVLDRSWKAMARDYGTAALSLITVINILIVIRDTVSFVARPLRKDGPRIQEHPAGKLLETLE
jgi:hypothetical protein